MGWKIDASDDKVVDGRPFDNPADTFEYAYNQRLRTDPEACAPDELLIDPYDGWPLPSHMFTREPENLGSLLDWYFHTDVQNAAFNAGNLPSELDAISTRLLGYAALPPRSRTPSARLRSASVSTWRGTRPVPKTPPGEALMQLVA